MRKRLSSFAGLRKGARVKVIANTNGHNYKVGDTYTLSTSVNGHNLSLTGGYFENYPHGNSLSIHDVEIVGYRTLTELQEERLELLKQIADIEKKIAFCKENRLDEFDDEIFTILDILDTVENKKLNKFQKAAKILSELHK